MNIKQCPFCGGDVILTWFMLPHFECQQCGLNATFFGKSKNMKKYILKKWNSRSEYGKE